MATATRLETRKVGNYQIELDLHQSFEFPMDELSLITPAITIVVYQLLAEPKGEQGAIREKVLYQAFQLGGKGEAERQAWIKSKLQAVVDLLSSATEGLDLVKAGLYRSYSAPTLYLLERDALRDGYIEALAFDAESGSHVRRSLINASSLQAVRKLISQEWQAELQNHSAAQGASFTIEHIAGCLLGGAVGDALGAGIRRAGKGPQFSSPDQVDYLPIKGTRGGLSWHSQMTLFTAEGLIRAKRRMDSKGMCDLVGVLLHAYYRWLAGQKQTMPKKASAPIENDGWLSTIAGLAARRGASPTVVEALQSGKRGSLEQPINTSKGAGGLARIAPVGLAGVSNSFELGCELAALTHGHASGYLAAGFFALLIERLVAGDSLEQALDAAEKALKAKPKHQECLKAVTRARELATGLPASASSIQQLGGGASAPEALAIAIFAALKAENFAHGVWLAINHGGDSDLTGALTGQLLGLLYGVQAIPERWLAQLELRKQINELANDFFLEFSNAPQASWFAADWSKYPGW